MIQTIIVTLEGNALAKKGYFEGVYHKSSMVEGKESWTSISRTSFSNAIWYYQGTNSWICLLFLEALVCSHTKKYIEISCAQKRNNKK